ncbi:hypothetical protein laban61_gp056 [Flavobacterium phage vB_FspS_laban6-1]|uniref:Uncharacterized protein n=1 Tax=Flavobacterium phage vB_FspS_laban6-1 TaxID=2686250 RepID=A0A6B9LAE8_9CAUD|nr:hypothetical protein HWC90_gp56 [Flavobacterium phage vB_FspS_laban6-1]QHB39027.1 hypothetical protein laban61_gp056 [Flavobacterium phage vB_FspS_laban6-1]
MCKCIFFVCFFCCNIVLKFSLFVTKLSKVQPYKQTFM